MRKEFELSDEHLAELLDASKPTPAMWLSRGLPMGGTPQENANRTWSILGETLGFKSAIVRPVPNKGQKFFTAELEETLP